MEFLEVRLRVPESRLDDLARFYGERLGLRVDGRAVQVGVTRLDLLPGEGEPFYHVALLAPGDRFDALLEWAAARVELLPDPRNGEVVFDFDFWGALACYFHDPAGNIVELIAHRGIGESGSDGPFAADELLGFSEVGVVGSPAAMAAELRERLALELWSGSVEGKGALGFVGVQARTLILSPEGRGWLPTGRPAEAHPLEVVLSGPDEGEAILEGGRYRVRRSAV